ncbi:MAG: pyruvate dehydrogenase (acetyl-transferring) E1 component subunit alpha [Gemmatimonadales bacterium]|nr:pyruvate dehydrogenase (acetyl-transferring) E1 component subunit alpha [Gemmatimonadales bacterium]
MAGTTARKQKRQPALAATAEECRAWLRQILVIRHFEEKAGEAYTLGKIGGFLHLYVGQEAVAVGCMAALRDDDYVTVSYRDHGHALARGMSARAVMAELYGKAAGCSGGKGGSMHLFDAERRLLGGHGIVGGHIPLAAGIAFASKYRDTDEVSVCLFGEAAVNIGSFHEALNMASLWKLPAVFVVENNGYGMGTALARASAIMDISHRGYSYAMETEVVDGQDVLAVKAAMDRAVKRAREQSGPSLLELRTYRYVGHSMSDAAHGTYRSKEEVEEYRQRDPIAVLRGYMAEHGYIDDEAFAAMDAEVKVEIDDAIAFAESAPDPEPGALYSDVYAEPE